MLKISENVNFRFKKVIRSKEEHNIEIRGWVSKVAK